MAGSRDVRKCVGQWIGEEMRSDRVGMKKRNLRRCGNLSHHLLLSK